MQHCIQNVCIFITQQLTQKLTLFPKTLHDLRQSQCSSVTKASTVTSNVAPTSIRSTKVRKQKSSIIEYFYSPTPLIYHQKLLITSRWHSVRVWLYCCQGCTYPKISKLFSGEVNHKYMIWISEFWVINVEYSYKCWMSLLLSTMSPQISPPVSWICTKLINSLALHVTDM
jgi:hypothetical protein